VLGTVGLAVRLVEGRLIREVSATGLKVATSVGVSEKGAGVGPGIGGEVGRGVSGGRVVGGGVGG